MKKKLLIAGCEGEIGKAVSRLFRKKDWEIVGIDFREGGKDVNTFIKVDVKNFTEVKEAINSIEESGPIFALFNAAGYECKKDFEEISAEEWNNLLQTILGGSANLCKFIGSAMAKRKEGKIVLLSADYSKEQGEHVVDATVAGTLHGFAKSFGVEMAPNNVLVNVLFANTPMDAEKVANTVLFLIEKDSYTTAQVVSISGEEN